MEKQGNVLKLFHCVKYPICRINRHHGRKTLKSDGYNNTLVTRAIPRTDCPPPPYRTFVWGVALKPPQPPPHSPSSLFLEWQFPSSGKPGEEGKRKRDRRRLIRRQTEMLVASCASLKKLETCFPIYYIVAAKNAAFLNY